MSCILPYKVQFHITCIISFNDFKDVINSKPYPKECVFCRLITQIKVHNWEISLLDSYGLKIPIHVSNIISYTNYAKRPYGNFFDYFHKKLK